MKIDPQKVKFTNNALLKIAEMIIEKVNLGNREKDILKNLVEVRKNNYVPAGYVQYIFFDHKGNLFQAGKYPDNRWGITL